MIYCAGIIQHLMLHTQ